LRENFLVFRVVCVRLSLTDFGQEGFGIENRLRSRRHRFFPPPLKIAGNHAPGEHTAHDTVKHRLETVQNSSVLAKTADSQDLSKLSFFMRLREWRRMALDFCEPI
jgi:hypothetical protein